MPLVVGCRAGIAIRHPKAKRIVEQNGDLACSCRNRLLLADAGRQPSIECPEAVSVRPRVMAASRSKAAARLEDRRVRDDSSLPPEILLPGARQSQEVKCFALGHAIRSVPHSATNFNAKDGPIP